MSQPIVGIIGGSGLGERLAAQSGAARLEVNTPFGLPSGPLLRSIWHGVDVVFLSRHGPGHTLNPSAVPYRANIFALKQLGVSIVLASGAAGSLREEIAPGDLVVCDQVIDKTYRRVPTFFDEGLAVHVELAEPFCPRLRKLLLSCAAPAVGRVHPRGTYVAMEGPQFSTRAEAEMHRQWGGDLIGMTGMPEARLAREAEMCYALVALPTDYDCWRQPRPGADKQSLLAEIIGNLNTASDNALRLLEAAVQGLAATDSAACSCPRALELGIWSERSRIDPRVVERLRPILGRYFPQ